MSEVVLGMLDLTDATVHRLGSVHLHAECGKYLDTVRIGPLASVSEEALRWCPVCWPGRSGP